MRFIECNSSIDVLLDVLFSQPEHSIEIHFHHRLLLSMYFSHGVLFMEWFGLAYGHKISMLVPARAFYRDRMFVLSGCVHWP